MVQDSELLRRYVEEGSQEALTAIVDRYIGLLYSVAVRRLSGTHLADDVVQTAFIDLARKARFLTGRPILAGWLYSAINYECANAIRENERRRRREREAQFLHEQNRTDTAEESWGKMGPIIDAAITTLSAGDREAVLLRFFCNLPFSEVGRQLNLTEEAARKRVDRALIRLRQSLLKKGVSSTTLALGTLLIQQPIPAVPARLSAQISSAAYLSGFKGVTAVSTAAKFFTVMMKTKSASLTAVLLGLIAAGFSVHQTKMLRRAEHDLIALQSELRTTQAKLAASEKTNQEVLDMARSTAASTQVVSSNVKNSSGARDETVAERSRHSPVNAKQNVAAEPASNNEIVMGDPTFAELSMKELTVGLPAVYAPLYRKLHLSAEQQKEFEEIMIEKQHSIFDGAQAARKAGIGVDDSRLSPVQDDIVLAASKRLIALLGPTGVDTLSAYELLDGGVKVMDLAGNLYSSEHPLTPEQGDALLHLLSSHTSRDATLKGLGGGEAKLDHEAVLAEAVNILSPDQFEIFRSMILKSVYGGEANDRALYLLKNSALDKSALHSAVATSTQEQPHG